MSVTWLKISSISLSEKHRHKSPLFGRFGIWLNWLKSTCIVLHICRISAEYLQSSSRSEGLHEEIHGMEDVELHSESCDFLLCCLRQPIGFTPQVEHENHWKPMRCWELMCVCTVSLSHCSLFTRFTACLHLHIGTSESWNVDPVHCIRVLRVPHHAPPCPQLRPPPEPPPCRDPSEVHPRHCWPRPPMAKMARSSTNKIPIKPQG